MTHEALFTRLGYRFDDPRLARQALTHRSYGTPHNERLEFLGDGVLNCAVASLLYERFPRLPEGHLSRLRANLVNQDSLSRLANQLDLGSDLLLGEGELKSGGFRRPSILADALEACFGAVFLDGGFDAAAGVIRTLYEPLVAELDPKAMGKDPKTLLQELLQGRHLALPTVSSGRGARRGARAAVPRRVPDPRAGDPHAGRGAEPAQRGAARRPARLRGGGGALGQQSWRTISRRNGGDRRPAQRGQVDAAQPPGRPEDQHHLAPAADHPPSHTRDRHAGRRPVRVRRHAGLAGAPRQSAQPRDESGCGRNARISRCDRAGSRGAALRPGGQARAGAAPARREESSSRSTRWTASIDANGFCRSWSSARRPIPSRRSCR